MPYTVVHECTQCGGPIEIDETHRLIACGHCGVRGLLVGERPRYLLSPRAGLPVSEGDDLLWAPYLRIRGGLFVVGDGGVGVRVLDATRRGLPSNALPETLGFRVQTQILKTLNERVHGRFLAFSLGAEKVLADMVTSALTEPVFPGGEPERSHDDFGFGDDPEGGSRSARVPPAPRATLPPICVGEIASVIFAPLRIKARRVLDAITGDPLGNLPPKFDLAALTLGAAPATHSRLSPALCPECGGDLTGEAASVVFPCGNCGVAWENVGDELVRREVQSEDARGADLHLPFWRIVPRAGAGVPPTIEAFEHATNQRVLGTRDKTAPVAFYCPAFAIRPQVMLRLAGRLTLAQWSVAAKDGAPAGKTHPVTLGAREAAKTMIATLADLSLPKHDLASRLDGVTFEIAEATLFYLGFKGAGQQLVDLRGRLAVDAKALAFAARG